jgi:hypothetical protein
MASTDRSAASETAGQSAASSPSPRLVGAALGILCALAVATVWVRSSNPDEFNWDVGWLLHCAARILEGARLYVDVVDENPPLIFWLSTIPVALSKLLSLRTLLVFELAVAALGLTSAWLSYRVLRAGWPRSPVAHSAALAALLVCLALVVPGRDFGQRENLLFAAIAPYLFAAGARASGLTLPVRLAASVGVLAGLGFAIKPYFLLTWVAVEAVVLASRRDGWRCVENAAVIGVHALYLGCVLLFAREYLGMIEMMGRFVEAYQEPGLSALRGTALVCVGGAAVFAALVPANRFDRALRRVLLAAALAGLATALFQGASFSYRYLPAEAAAVLLAGAIALGSALEVDSSRIRWRRGAGMLPLVCVIAFAAWSAAVLARESTRVVSPGAERHSVVRQLVSLVSERASDRPIWVMSTEVWPAFPVVNLTGAGWASRFCCVFVPSGVYTPEEKATVPFPYHDMSRLGDLERMHYDAVVEDLQRTPPELLIVDSGRWKQTFGETDFDFLTYFRRDPRFEQIFREYRPFAQIGKFQVYRRRFGGSL